MRYHELIESAREARRKGNFREAIEYYREAFSKKVLVQDLVDYALVHLDNNQPQQAIEILEDVSEVFPEIPELHFYLGMAHEQIGQKEEAARNYLEAVHQDPSFSDAYFCLALLADDADDEELAAEYYKKTLLYDPDHYWANLNLGSHYERTDRLELALAYTRKAHEINPDEKMAAYNLGVVYGKMGKFEEAEKYYLEEIRKGGYALAYLNLALLYKDCFHDYEKAKYIYLEGISKDKDNATLWYNLACVYALLNDFENCYSCLLYALVRDPKLKEFMLLDEELRTFMESPYYEKLKKETG
ncbi:MAG TPA: tetratricopeptide repeat protein [Acholeplasmataceae bacterium]|nr:tetratricopeptide repeat protein [Acholeplasmataceae bacterium]